MPSPFSILQSIAEEKIQEAQKKGEFDDLPGRGAPIIYEDDSFVPEELRMAYKLLKNAGCVPPEVQEKKEISNLADMLEKCTDEQTRVRQMRKLEAMILRAKIRGGRSLQLQEIDDGYFDKILDRIHVADKKGEK